MVKVVDKKKFQPQVNVDFCKACEYCVFQCPMKMFKPSGQINSHGYNYMTVEQNGKCIGCLRCINICPDFAITVHEL